MPGPPFKIRSGGREWPLVRRLLSSAVGLALGAGCLIAGVAPAAASTAVGTKTLLNSLAVTAEHRGGYSGAAFGPWWDADRDGCATPQEVMIRDAADAPQVQGDCSLSGGRWTSRYDGQVVTDPSQLRVDFLVSRQEAWQSNAWRWDADTRHRFMNDLGDARVLLAVTAAAAKSKAGREPTDWMPSNAAFRCRYLTWWVAVKWRWRLSVNSNEKSFLAKHLGACGWPSVAKPSRAKVVYSTAVFSFVGDTILGKTPNLPNNPYSYLSPVIGQIRQGVDVGFANLEGTLTNSTAAKCSGGDACYTFRNPPSYARVFAWAGYDVLNLANNHSHDFGATGLQDTKDAIHSAGIRYTGLPGQITYLTSNGIRVAYVGFAPYSNTNNMLDLSTAARLIRRANANAAIVVVYMHAGAEGADADHVTGREEHYVGEDRGNPKRFAHMAVNNGASIVVASGPHVMRGMEFYRHRLIAYSLGNFANFHNFNTTGVLSHSAVLRVTLTKTGRFATARLVSVSLASDGHATVGGSSVSFVRSLSSSDFGSAAARLSSSGVVSQP
jgi:poly-gamma-glutamate capsule biosynthesis protein CapA/YwtB (metallophosphatase superfamily)